MSGYPITLIGLKSARCVVVGGGEVAVRKVAALREAGVCPVVISSELCESLQDQAERGEIDTIQRAYQSGDLAGARLVIAATDDPATNEAVWREAQAAGCLVNVVDDPAHCDFHVPATMRRGPLTISVSTDGRSPALAARIRAQLDGLFGPEYASLLDVLGELREWISCRCPSERRRDLWYELVDSDLLELLREGKEQQARERAVAIVNTYLERCDSRGESGDHRDRPEP